MLLDEGHGRIYVGAKNTLFSLSLDQVNTQHREIQWASTEPQIEECLMKGREKSECANYIKVLQQYNQTHLLVCGTGAFNPTCVLVRVGHTAQVSPKDRVNNQVFKFLLLLILMDMLQFNVCVSCLNGVVHCVCILASIQHRLHSSLQVCSSTATTIHPRC
ncbi:Semaphorin-3E [Liparis tanakae]|uniref:Semaphorin-3E n=1 Tax=Liparis tanakae TaxID=230148 RepID=A0A4Z2EXJ1_9TELE|nr:Semaphorin-3E [Liparis tanakae]